MNEEIIKFIEWLSFSGEVEPCFEEGQKKWYLNDPPPNHKFTLTTEEVYEYYIKITKK